MSKLFSVLKIKDLELKNRIVMAPMCMYSSDDSGKANEFHTVHYTTRAVGGVGLIIFEATGVEGRGRITDRDLGLWEDSQIDGLKRIVEACKKYGSKVGIQLGHAGRKCEAPNEAIIAPSALAFSDKYRTPKEMSREDIEAVINAFKEAARRAEEAGFDTIEIHGAHGYLINQFLSPLSNKRKDEYGGSIENRARFLKQIVKAVREIWPKEKALILRVSAEDYSPEGNHPEDLAEIINIVKSEGVDIINVSSGGVAPIAPKSFPGYQVKFAEIIKERTGLVVMAGGLLELPEHVEEILQNDRADLVFLARELLRNPYWPLQASAALGDDAKYPVQYERSKKRR